MKLNLDTVRTEIDGHLKANGFVVFYGFARSDEGKTVEWDTDQHPDFKEFLVSAKELDVKLIVLHQRSFDGSVVDHALAQLEESELELDDRRTLEGRLKELGKYDGFTCSLELSFDYEDITYIYELHAEWFEELGDLLVQLDIGLESDAEDEDEEEEGPYGGYYSKN